VLEVAVVTAAPEQSAAPPQPAPPVEPVTEAPAAPREAAPPVDPAPAAAAPPPAEDAVRQAEPAEPKPAPAEPAKAVEKPPEPAKPHAAPPQTAARPPAQISHGTEGTAHGVAHESSIAPTIKTLTTPTPEYPRVAIQYREEGTVYLTVTIGVDGVPTAVTLYKSSGFGSLDEAAIKTMRQWRFVPVLKNGRPEAVTIYVPMEFRLKHHDG
jgi:protein TonB